MELWSTGKFFPRLLAILIMDNKHISQDLIDKLDQDMHPHPFDERNQLMDWIMANIKVKWYQKGVRLIICQSSLPLKVASEIYNLQTRKC